MAREKDSQKRVPKTYKGPRVHIGLEVDDSGAIRKREIPFVVGVLAPLSGSANAVPWDQQEPIEINRLNFDDVMKRIGPTLGFSVQSKLAGASKNDLLPVDVKFEKMEDFEPEQVASKIPALAKKLELRRALRDLLLRLRANPRLRSEVEKALQNEETRTQLREQIGAQGQNP